MTDDQDDIWIWDFVRKTSTRLTLDKTREFEPIWTPDGKRIVYSSGPATGDCGLYWKAADGRGEVERLASVPGKVLLPYSWSSDGKTLVILETDWANWDIGMLSMEGTRPRKLLLQERQVAEIEPRISPDGRWMAYASDESGRDEIYVRPFPDVTNGRWQVSTGGGNSPLWSPDGRMLYYLSMSSAMAVAVETAPAFSAGTPKPLFHGPYVKPGLGESIPWDISGDGKRFLMMKEAGATASGGESPMSINITINWFEELNQRVPVK